MKINYTVKLETSAVTASLGVIGKDIDVIVKRDSQGYPFFSGKHIKGIVRERSRQFKIALNESPDDFINKYFGKEGNYLLEKDSPKLRFANLVLENKKSAFNKTKSRYGIKVDRKTRSTVDNSLFNYEFVLKDEIFKGEIDIDCKTLDDNFKSDLKLLIASLFHMDSIGGLKSRGLGKVKVLVEKKELKDIDIIINDLMNNEKINKKNIGMLNYKKFSYSLKFEEAFILTKRQMGNYIEVRNSIQGSTIRGAMIAYFIKNFDIELKELLKIEASNAEKEEVKLASLFETKYPIGSKKVKKDRVIYLDKEVNGIKLERCSLESFSTSGNEMSVKIDEKTKSAEEGMLFNTEFVEAYRENGTDIEFKGDIYLPQELVELDKDYEIYIGRLKFKGFGKAIIKFSEYSEEEKESLEKRIETLTTEVEKGIKEKESNKDMDKNMSEYNYFITFDLQSDLVLPFISIYNVGAQFKTLANLDNDDFLFDYVRSFINTGRLQGYSIINNSRKMDEIILVKGSVLTYRVKDYKKYLEILEKIEKKGLGLRKNEGFGRIQICTPRLRGDR